MARTVKDAAYILSAIAGRDQYDNWTLAQPFEEPPDYVKACNMFGLMGARIGIPRNGIEYFLDSTSDPVLAAFTDALDILRGAEATVVDHANFPVFDFPSFSRSSSIVLDVDFVAGLSNYFSLLETNPQNIYSLKDVADFSRAEPHEEFPGRDTYVWDRQLTRNITNTSPEAWSAYQANLFMGGEQGVLGALDAHNLDALIMPTFASFHLPAIAGLPVITVPLGSYPENTPITMNPKGNLISVAPNIPFGIAFLGRKWSEESLISFAYAFEQRTMARTKVKPYIRPSFELGRGEGHNVVGTIQFVWGGLVRAPNFQSIFRRAFAHSTAHLGKLRSFTGQNVRIHRLIRSVF